MEELDLAGQFIADRVVITGADDDFTPRTEVETAIRSWAIPGIIVGDDWRVERIISESQRLDFDTTGGGSARSGPGASSASGWRPQSDQR